MSNGVNESGIRLPALKPHVERTLNKATKPKYAIDEIFSLPMKALQR
jgi:hypothetical protein